MAFSQELQPDIFSYSIVLDGMPETRPSETFRTWNNWKLWNASSTIPIISHQRGHIKVPATVQNQFVYCFFWLDWRLYKSLCKQWPDPNVGTMLTSTPTMIPSGGRIQSRLLRTVTAIALCDILSMARMNLNIRNDDMNHMINSCFDMFYLPFSVGDVLFTLSPWSNMNDQIMIKYKHLSLVKLCWYIAQMLLLYALRLDLF